MERVNECRKMAENLIDSVCSLSGCDRPNNRDDIVNFIVQDVEETADPIDWHSGDVGIAFRRWMEHNSNF